jgi:hypothetical protein
MDRSSLIKGGLIMLLIALYVGGRMAQDRAANPPQPDASPAPATQESAPQKVDLPRISGR